MSSPQILCLGVFALGFGIGLLIAWLTPPVPPVHPDTVELRRIRAFAEKQGCEMDGTEAEHWSDSRCPDGDDWDDLYAQIRSK